MVNLRGFKVNSFIPFEHVLFSSGSDQLPASSFSELNRLKMLLTENPTFLIRLRGHTDEVGATDYNQSLSDKRAKAVAQYLVNEGIKANRIRIEGKGEESPVADNQTSLGKALNRRVEVFILMR